MSSDGCGLEAKRLLEELEIIMHAFDIEMVENEFWRKEIFERASRALKVYMVWNLITEEKLEELLKNWFWKLEREKEKTKNIQELPENILNTFIEAMPINKSGERTAGVKCFFLR